MSGVCVCAQVTEAEWYRFLAELEAADGKSTVKFLMRRLETAGMVQDAEEAAEGRQDEAQADAYKQQIASLEGELADAKAGSKGAVEDAKAEVAKLRQQLQDREAELKGARALAAAPVVAAREAQGAVGSGHVGGSSEVTAMPSEAARARRLWYRLDKGGEGKASKESIVMLHNTGGWRRGGRGALGCMCAMCDVCEEGRQRLSVGRAVGDRVGG